MTCQTTVDAILVDSHAAVAIYCMFVVVALIYCRTLYTHCGVCFNPLHTTYAFVYT